MRFLQDGPSIPDELLVARDRGEVALICGAGVSRAFAGLPDFLQLAKNVAEQLGDRIDSPARRLIEEIPRVEKEVGVQGVISADQVFSLFEREFSTQDIGNAVSRCLTVESDVDLKAHDILLRLARNKLGKTQLITTNFDHLFECAGCTKYSEPPSLPNPLEENWLDGIVYLHGRLNSDAKGAQESFVLSSSTFGRAYLSDGWATKFLKDVLDRHIVVFIGYEADDPPVRYLLEALKNREHSGRVFVFCPESDSHVESKWKQRGVTEIPFSLSDDFRHLWESLECWAARADDVDEWYKKTLKLAVGSPSSLLPHERGMVAHLASTEKGARLFAQSGTPPKAEWICSFDPVCRFAEEQLIYDGFEHIETIDPHEIYGLDRDTNLSETNSNVESGNVAKRVRWSAFDPRAVPSSIQVARFRQSRDGMQPELSNRLDFLARWLGQVAVDPITLWWAKRQVSVHLRVRLYLENAIRLKAEELECEQFEAWQRVFESWRYALSDRNLELHQFVSSMVGMKWTIADAMRFGSLMEPRIRIDSRRSGSSIPLKTSSNDRRLFSSGFIVEYPRLDRKVDIPENQLKVVTRLIRTQLERAVELEEQLGGYAIQFVGPLGGESSDFESSNGLSSLIRLFMSQFERLTLVFPSAAKSEVAQWRIEKGLFFRLQLWWHGKFGRSSTFSCYRLLRKADDALFWDDTARPELLHTLRARWIAFTEKNRRKLAERLLRGPQVDSGCIAGEQAEAAAWKVLQCITWLERHGCEVSSDWARKKRELVTKLPDWKDEFAESADRGNKIEGGCGSQETDCDSLLSLPLSGILQAAQRRDSRKDFLIQHVPFVGLCKERPARALIALGMAAKADQFPSEFWRNFLGRADRKTDSTRMMSAILGRLLSFPDDDLSECASDISAWLSDVVVKLAVTECGRIDELTIKLVEVAHDYVSKEVGSICDPKWARTALYGRIGKLVDFLFLDKRIRDKKGDEGVEESWSKLSALLLDPSRPGYLMSITAFAFRAHFLLWVDRNWVEEFLLDVRSSDTTEHDRALCFGALASPRSPSQVLYEKLKPIILSSVISDVPVDHEFVGRLGRFLLVGWKGNEKESVPQLMSDADLRQALIDTSESVRIAVLDFLWRWTADPDVHSSAFWKEALPRFFRDVWPKQTLFRSSESTSGMVNLVLDGRCRSKALLEAVLPHLIPLEQEYVDIDRLHDETGPDLLSQFPGLILDFIHKIFPSESRFWPLDFDGTLRRIIEVEPKLATDARYVSIVGD